MLTRPVARHRCRSALLALLICVGACLGATGVASAQSGATVLICEATGNPSAPYVEIRVNQSDLGNYSTGEGDIIPAPAAGCPGASGATAPVETSATATTTTSSTTSSTATSSASSTSSAAPVVHHKHKTGSSGTKGTATSLAATNPVVATSTSSTEDLTPDVTTISTLPRTGGQVPLTVALGLVVLFAAALLSLALGRARRRDGTDPR